MANKYAIYGDALGVFDAADRTKLDGLESGATADQTGAEIKTAYEGESDTNAYTDAAVTNLGNCVTHKDVTSGNPHSVTKTEVGLANVTNDAQLTAAQKGSANGVAELDSGGKVPVAQIPDTVVGAMDYQGSWNASTNSPDLPAASPSKGDYYVVSTSGSTSLGGITDWVAGDIAVYNGTAWEKIDNTDLVASVAGKTGAVTLDTDDVSEGSNLYYTEVRVSANTDVAANTSAKHTHSNSGVLDATTASFLTADETKLDNMAEPFVGSQQTSDATPASFATYTPADGKAATVKATVAARKNDGTQAGGWELFGVFRRAAGTTTQVGSTDVMAVCRDDGDWAATLIASGSDVKVQVTGKAAATIDWDVIGSAVVTP